MARFSSLLKAKTSFVIKRLSRSESRSLGYAHWPEHANNKVVNKTTAGQECIGVAVSAAANPSATVLVKLGQFVAEGT